jgi:hypothetical protein
VTLTTSPRRFRPLPGANPTIGSIGVVEEVAEEKIESICLEEFLTPVCDAVKAAHPYEGPAIHITRVLDYASFLSASSIPAGLGNASTLFGLSVRTLF